MTARPFPFRPCCANTPFSFGSPCFSTAMEEDFLDVPMCREFIQLPEFTRLPDESTVLRVRLRLERSVLSATPWCMARRRWSLAMRAVAVSTNVPMPRLMSPGTWPCARVCAVEAVDGSTQYDGCQLLRAPKIRDTGAGYAEHH